MLDTIDYLVGYLFGAIAIVGIVYVIVSGIRGLIKKKKR